MDRPADLDLARTIRTAMRSEPLATAVLMSEVVEASAAASEEHGIPALTMLVDSFIGVSIAETTAALHILASLISDELTVTRIRRELARRRHPMPLDVAEFDNLRVVRAVEMRIPFDVGDDLILELRGPGVRDICLLVYVDHRQGTLVKDAFLLPHSLPDAIAQLREVAARDRYVPEFPDVDLADARARLEGAITGYETLDHGLEPNETWPGLKPLARFLMTHLPEGGTTYPERGPLPGYGGAFGALPGLDDLGGLDDEDAAFEGSELAHLFLDDVSRRGLGDDPLDHDLAHACAAMAVSLPSGEYRWEPTDITNALLHVLPVLLTSDPQEYARAPELLRAFVRFCHEHDEVDEDATLRALAAIDRHRADFLATRTDPDVVQARLDLSEAAGATEPAEDEYDWLEARERSLVAMVGSVEAMARLDTDPLPDEGLDTTGLPADIVERVWRTSTLADGAVDTLWGDVEMRTASRRLLAKVAAGDPAIFRRPSKDETAAAAIVWLVGQANEAITYVGFPSVGELMTHFSLTGSPSQRAMPMLAAAGGVQPASGVVALGDPGLLTARTRQRALNRWDLLG